MWNKHLWGISAMTLRKGFFVITQWLTIVFVFSYLGVINIPLFEAGINMSFEKEYW